MHQKARVQFRAGSWRIRIALLIIWSGIHAWWIWIPAALLTQSPYALLLLGYAVFMTFPGRIFWFPLLTVEEIDRFDPLLQDSGPIDFR